MQTITVTKETALVRPLVSGAILRNLKFTKDTYNSFIALQDKLHANLAYVERMSRRKGRKEMFCMAF